VDVDEFVRAASSRARPCVICGNTAALEFMRAVQDSQKRQRRIVPRRILAAKLTEVAGEAIGERAVRTHVEGSHDHARKEPS
jgi:hypothetical protein